MNLMALTAGVDVISARSLAWIQLSTSSRSDTAIPVEWITASDTAAEDYAGDGELPLYDGMPITLSWNGDNYKWAAAAQTPAELQEVTTT